MCIVEQTLAALGVSFKVDRTSPPSASDERRGSRTNSGSNSNRNSNRNNSREVEGTHHLPQTFELQPGLQQWQRLQGNHQAFRALLLQSPRSDPSPLSPPHVGKPLLLTSRLQAGQGVVGTGHRQGLGWTLHCPCEASRLFQLSFTVARIFRRFQKPLHQKKRYGDDINRFWLIVWNLDDINRFWLIVVWMASIVFGYSWNLCIVVGGYIDCSVCGIQLLYTQRGGRQNHVDLCVTSRNFEETGRQRINARPFPAASVTTHSSMQRKVVQSA